MKSINKATKKFAEKLKIPDRMECMDESEAYITIKDKRILDQINKNISQNTNVNQWRNSTSVIDWFKAIHNKPQYRFFVFDIENVYQSISLDLYEKVLNFSKQITPIADSNLRTVMHSRKTLLFHESEKAKREGNKNFDVPMGCFDGAEVCELVGTYILSQLNLVFENENVGLYRDGGLGIFRNLSGPEIARTRRAIVRVFELCGLSITTKANLKVVNF